MYIVMVIVYSEYADYKTAIYAAMRAEETSNVDSEHDARPLKRPWRFEETGSSGESDPHGRCTTVMAYLRLTKL